MRQPNEKRPDDSVSQAAAALRARLIAGEKGWTYGVQIPGEARLAGELGLARTTVRRAVEVLADEGWLDRQRGRRPRVSRRAEPIPGPMTIARQAEILEVIEARRALECEAARLAALRRTGADLVRMSDALRRRQEAGRDGNDRGTVAADTEFHDAVVRAAGNRTLATLFAALDDDITGVLLDLHAHDLASEESSAAHEDLAIAIEVQDPDRAALSVRRLFAATERRLRG